MHMPTPARTTGQAHRYLKYAHASACSIVLYAAKLLFNLDTRITVNPFRMPSWNRIIRYQGTGIGRLFRALHHRQRAASASRLRSHRSCFCLSVLSSGKSWNPIDISSSQIAVHRVQVAPLKKRAVRPHMEPLRLAR